MILVRCSGCGRVGPNPTTGRKDVWDVTHCPECGGDHGTLVNELLLRAIICYSKACKL